MKLLIVEDEPLAQERLHDLILRYDPTAELVAAVDSMQKAQPFLEGKGKFDLAFMDIQLSDGPVFDLLERRHTLQPIVFTTAYDQFMQKAFKVNCIDYLLKPIKFEKLRAALDKYRNLQLQEVYPNAPMHSQQVPTKPQKKRFLVKVGNRLVFISLAEVAYFYAEGQHTFLVKRNGGGEFIIEHSLEQLEKEILSPDEFFRINRKFIVKLDVLKEVRSHYNKRLKVELNTACPNDLIVSRERVPKFKSWLNA